MKKNAFLVFLLVLGYSLNVQGQLTRYKDVVFANVKSSKNVVYGSNIPFASNDPQDLLMDVYEPNGDTAKARPVLIFIHSGSFLNANLQGGKAPAGVKEDHWVVEACNHYAQRGYVTIALSHRVGWNPTLLTIEGRSKSIMEAVWRARQDLKGCIRFLRKDAATTNNYRINPEQIAAGGSSSGGYVAIHAAILNKPEELTYEKFLDSEGKPFIDTVKLGGFEGESGSKGYSSKFKVIMNWGGAVGDTLFQESGDPPIIAVHGTNDQTTPYKTALVVTATGSIPIIEVSGSYDLVRKSQQLGNQKPLIDKGFNDAPFAGLKPFDNLGFEFYNYWNTTPTADIPATKNRLTETFDFFTPRLFATLDLPTINFDKVVGRTDATFIKQQLKFFYNPNSDKIEVQSLTGALQIENCVVTDIMGRRLGSFNSTSWNTGNLPDGIYNLSVVTNLGTTSFKWIKE